ncbi:3-hydroxyisobutyrate dehydrogenase [Pelagibius sp. CAU 1746]|uniref:3-hydroxyisobutyrate dehydrogenase n=1 Tax=Pelagibius sp. CAU 1746 TaxID=3140370 RepID=UPI00325BDD74
MARIGFLGLGNMGLPMAKNLVKDGHEVVGFDLSETACKAAAAAGITLAGAAAEVVGGAETVVTMLPAGQHVRAVYLGGEGLLAKAAKGTLFIDCSTIDVATSRDVHAAAAEAGHAMLDAPVSGGVAGAEAGTLTFMVGGAEDAFAKGKPLFDIMGRNIVHAGGAGNGQAAKICNNMILGISMIAVSEAFSLGEKLGLDPKTLFDISSNASGSCWAMLNHNPVPGIVETSAANRDYQPGFAAAMMHKDLKLSQAAADHVGAATPLGAEAAALYTLFVNAGNGGLDYSAIIKLIGGAKS